jgi:glycosyltransferase involved in cell wall biosynthesis
MMEVSNHAVNIRFLTSTPLDVRGGSGTFVGIRVLADALEAMGHSIAWETPQVRLPMYTAQRWIYNRRLRVDPRFDLTVGFDLDGYRIAGGCDTHVASLKGVVADEARFEHGVTRATMSMQAGWERAHVQRAARVVCTSRYSAEIARDQYGLPSLPAIVPELIQVSEWRQLLDRHPATSERFAVLFVGRFYRRKRVDILLRAAAILRGRIPGLDIRIVGNGPCAKGLHALSRELRLEGVVTWLGDVSRADLVREYNRASVFCLPSVQEGFGIVLLEAMAAGRAIVAARAAAIPEVAPHAEPFEPDQPESLAAAIEALYRSPEMRARQVRAGLEWVEQFEASRVAARFLEAAAGVRVTSASARS